MKKIEKIKEITIEREAEKINPRKEKIISREKRRISFFILVKPANT
jgi:hypothetical protein